MRVGRLVELTRTLADEHDLPRALKAVTEAALHLLPCVTAAIHLFDGVVGSKPAARSSNVYGRPSVVVPDAIFRWAAENGARVRVGDISQDSRCFPLGGAARPTSGSAMVVPMWSLRRVIGILGIGSPVLSAFTPAHEDIARLLANCAVPVVERSRQEHLNTRDHLTNTFGHRYLMPRLQREMDDATRSHTPLCLALLDVDHFKSVNDAHGHGVGDAALVESISRMQACVRQRDVLVRRGGDEFVLILPRTPLDLARRVAERIRRAIASKPVVARSIPLPLTVSIGVAGWNKMAGGPALEASADRAMYAAKRQGRNRVETAQ